ncbi:MAG: hypothetical protein ACD_23C00594G0002 [uncultured bacterium]|jgi:hypothetical protein|nr:MAG: hypothetical protein ACD_23C00594G0002 [uncultured bacterium]
MAVRASQQIPVGLIEAPFFLTREGRCVRSKVNGKPPLPQLRPTFEGIMARSKAWRHPAGSPHKTNHPHVKSTSCGQLTGDIVSQRSRSLGLTAVQRLKRPSGPMMDRSVKVRPL